MADEPNEAGDKGPRSFSAGKSPPETQVGDLPALSMDLGFPKADRVVDRTGPGLETEVGTGKSTASDGMELTEEETQELTEEGTEGTTETKPAETTTAEPLPAFDAAKPEVVEAYDARYLTQDGQFNEDALNADWMANIKDGDPTSGSLSEGSYKWLETRGFNRDFIKRMEKAVISERLTEAGARMQIAGGTEQYQTALDWGRQNYTKDQQAKFNAAVNGKDREEAEVAITTLVARFKKAKPEQRRASPQRTVQSTAGGRPTAAIQGFTNRAEWSAALKEARDANKGQGDPAKLAQVRARLKASSWA